MQGQFVQYALGALTLAALVGLGSTRVCAQSATGEFDPAGWQLIFGDEFDGPTIDTSKWRIEDAFLVKNNELQYYAPDDAYIQNGRLVLRSQERQYWGWDTWNWRWFDYTSGLVETKGRFAMTYGRIEIRAKLPKTQGIWPAHWMLPVRDVWPPELDIMEMLGHEPQRVYTTHHWGTWPNVQSNGDSYDGPDYALGFHDFAIEWFPGRLDWYIDGELTFTSISGSIPTEAFYIILNTAVGGIWPGNPDATTVFPQYHEIEYVRAYQLIGAGAPLQNMLDVTEASAVADGHVDPGEYALSTTGLNRGLFDRIGDDSIFAIDSSVDGRLNFGFDSANAWPSSGSYGVVLYIDSVPGGFSSTKDLHNTSDLHRRLVSGQGTAGQDADLYFAPGFEADYAITLTAGEARIYAISAGSHSLIQGANLGAAQDIQGGTDVAYAIDANDSSMRELELRLSHIGVAPGGSFNVIGTFIYDGNTAFRTNEFIGVSEGNAWDNANPASNPATIKSGDFLTFSTALRKGDANGDGEVHADDVSGWVECMGGPGVAPLASEPVPCLRAMDADLDGDVDLADVAYLSTLLGD